MVTKEEQYRKMTLTPIPKLMVSLSVPAVFSQLVTTIYNTADTYFVSQIGTSAAAAVGVVFSLQSLIQAFGYGTSMGAQSTISVLLGEKKSDEADRIASSAIAAAMVFGLCLMTVCLTFLQPLMRLLGSTQTMLSYTCAYARYILIGAPMMCSSYVFNGLLKAQGEAKLSMYGLCAGSIINIFLDPLLIFKLNMGIAGAAIATVLSQLISFFILIGMFLRNKSTVHVSIRYVSRNPKDYFRIYRAGLPTICRQGLASVASALLNIQASFYGDAVIAAATISNKVYLFVRNLTMGIGQGFMVIAGFNYGAKINARVRKAFFVAVAFGTTIGLIGFFTVFFNAHSIITWFRADDPEVIMLGTFGLKLVASVMPLMAFSTYVNQILQGLGFAKRAVFMASCRQGVFFVPLIFLLPYLFKVTGVMMAQPSSDFLTFVVAVPVLICFMKKELKD